MQGGTVNTETINLAHVKRFKRMGSHILVWFGDGKDLTHYKMTSQVAAEQKLAEIIEGLSERYLMI